jgi:tRNA(fMet)-specific endonuclease VapC
MILRFSDSHILSGGGMRQEVGVTEIQRNFSDYMNRVAYRDEAFVLVRGGRPMAQLLPLRTGGRLGDLPGLLRSLPPLARGDEAEPTDSPDPPARPGEPEFPEPSPPFGTFDRGVLLDGFVLEAHARGELDAEALVAGREEVPFHLSVITVGELLRQVRGLADPVTRARRTAFVDAVADRFPLLPGDLPTARVHAELWGWLVDAGVRLNPHDLWLVAGAAAHGLSLATTHPDRFQGLPGLQVEDWRG